MEKVCVMYSHGRDADGYFRPFLLLSRSDCLKDRESGRYPFWSRILCSPSVRSDLRTVLEKLANCPVQGCLQAN